jgi:hypothetical protein
MTVTLELKPEVEALAIEQAASRGIQVKDFLESVIEDRLNSGEGDCVYQTAEEWETALDEFADSPAFGKALSLVDDSRESIYREREDSQL